MFILFVSDIHLHDTKPNIVESFINFLYNHAINAQELYILGDLFELWIGDDYYNPLHIKISNALRYLYQNHTKCYFIHGNHDFLLGEKYANDCGMILLPSQKTLEFLGHRIIILHGDVLCTHDKNYQRFRKYIRQKWIQKIFLSLPISIRLYIGNIIIKNKNHYQIITQNSNQQNIKKILLQNNADFMIHGHFHQEKIYYNINNNSQKLERVVLGNWEKNGSIIKISKTGIYLTKFSFKKYFKICSL